MIIKTGNIVRAVRFDRITAFAGVNYFCTYPLSFDPVYQFLIQSCRTSAPLPLLPQLGYVGYDSNDELPVFEPAPSNFAYSVSRDKELFLGILSRFQRPAPPPNGDEKDVDHARLAGTVYPGDGLFNLPIDYTDLTICGIEHQRYQFSACQSVNYDGGFNRESDGIIYAGEIAQGIAVLNDYLGAGGYSYTLHSGSSYRRNTVNSFEYSIVDNVLTCSWSVTHKQWFSNQAISSNKWIAMDLQYIWSIELDEQPDLAFFPQTIRSYDVVQPFDNQRLSITALSNPYWGNSSYPATSSWHTWRSQIGTGLEYFASSENHIQSVVGSIGTPGNRYFHYLNVFDECNNFVNDQRRELWAGCFYSTINAVETFLNVIKTNHIETLSELNAISDIIPAQSFLNMERLLKREPNILRRVDSGVGLANAFSSEYLRYVFGTAPTIAAGVEFLSKFDQLSARIRIAGDLGTHTLYGKHYLDLDSFGPFSEFTLTCRSKARVKFPTSTLLGCVIGTQMAGLSPRPSNLYETVPFSFVLDWFTNTGQRIADIESRFFLLTLGLHSITHSLTIEGKISTHPTDSFTDHPKYRYYGRRVSRYSPSLKSTKIDFRAPPGPPLLTASALFAQVVVF
jgi:hypothetical protein